MLTESALVVSTKGTRARVRAYRGEACSSCSAAGACKALGGGKEMEIEVLNYIQAKVDDLVELSLPESSFVQASIMTWIVPLAGLMGGAAAGAFASDPLGWSKNALSVIMAFVGLGLSLTIVRWYNARLDANERFIPRITRVLPGKPETELIPEGGECRI